MSSRARGNVFLPIIGPSENTPIAFQQVCIEKWMKRDSAGVVSLQLHYGRIAVFYFFVIFRVANTFILGVFKEHFGGQTSI